MLKKTTSKCVEVNKLSAKQVQEPISNHTSFTLLDIFTCIFHVSFQEIANNNDFGHHGH
jgi:hypothetical protein